MLIGQIDKQTKSFRSSVGVLKNSLGGHGVTNHNFRGEILVLSFLLDCNYIPFPIIHIALALTDRHKLLKFV